MIEELKRRELVLSFPEGVCPWRDMCSTLECTDDRQKRERTEA